VISGIPQLIAPRHNVREALWNIRHSSMRDDGARETEQLVGMFVQRLVRAECLCFVRKQTSKNTDLLT
jgi:hypothetical protein